MRRLACVKQPGNKATPRAAHVRMRGAGVQGHVKYLEQSCVCVCVRVCVCMCVGAVAVARGARLGEEACAARRGRRRRAEEGADFQTGRRWAAAWQERLSAGGFRGARCWARAVRGWSGQSWWRSSPGARARWRPRGPRRRGGAAGSAARSCRRATRAAGAASAARWACRQRPRTARPRSAGRRRGRGGARRRWSRAWRRRARGSAAAAGRASGPAATASSGAAPPAHRSCRRGAPRGRAARRQ
mmetsp:Transcript_67844/g.164045  ORF Transcript_67844/g.164045 Transcript_67844/m.164045 type:complete len:244 (+) Transcript_67844:248-979(+)